MAIPEISIITPVFNGEKYLNEVIDSVMSQHGIAVQMIIVNDGSTDSSLRIAEEWRKRFPEKIEVIDQPNSGEASAVNNGMTKVKAKFVGIVNADDPLLPGHCRKMVAALTTDSMAVVAYPDWLMINDNGVKIRIVKTLDYTKRSLIADLVCLPGPGAIIRVESLSDFPLREKRFRYISDYVLWIRMTNKGTFIRIPEVLATWRQHAGGATASAGSGAISSEMRYLVENEFLDFCDETIPRKWLRSARAHAKYYEALGKLSNKQVQGRRLLLKSLLIKPYPSYGYPTHHRSVRISIAVLMGSFGRAMVEWRKAKKGLI